MSTVLAPRPPRPRPCIGVCNACNGFFFSPDGLRSGNCWDCTPTPPPPPVPTTARPGRSRAPRNRTDCRVCGGSRDSRDRHAGPDGSCADCYDRVING
jgi:hypothetical protein